MMASVMRRDTPEYKSRKYVNDMSYFKRKLDSPLRGKTGTIACVFLYQRLSDPRVYLRVYIFILVSNSSSFFNRLSIASVLLASSILPIFFKAMTL